MSLYTAAAAAAAAGIPMENTKYLYTVYAEAFSLFFFILHSKLL